MCAYFQTKRIVVATYTMSRPHTWKHGGIATSPSRLESDRKVFSQLSFLLKFSVSDQTACMYEPRVFYSLKFRILRE